VVPEPPGDRGPAEGLSSPRTSRVEWLSTTNPDGSVSKRKFPLPRSLANVKRGFSEQKWADAQGLGQEVARPDQEPQVPPLRETEAGPHGGEGQQAPRLAVLPAEDGALLDRPVSGLDNPLTGRHLLVVLVQHPDPGASVQELPPMEEPAEDPLEDRPGGDEEASRTHPG